VGRHLVSTAALWAALTAIGEVLVFSPMFPTVGSSSAEESDHIFRVLCFMGVPVFAFVIAVLVYSLFLFKGTGDEGDNGQKFWGTGAVPRIWLAVTGSLALTVMVYPGLTGLSDLQSDKTGYGWGSEDPEMVIQVTGYRFFWQYDFPATGAQIIRPNVDLLLPVNTRIKFEIRGADVIHSFWIPAFRLKIDAIPGRTTFFTVTPTELGEFSEDDAYRVQCAELCGLDHSLMRTHVRVVERAEFDAWLAEQPQAAK
jgi:cytochrome c oxidase subunit 2